MNHDNGVVEALLLVLRATKVHVFVDLVNTSHLQSCTELAELRSWTYYRETSLQPLQTGI